MTLPRRSAFPPPERANPEGVVAIGGRPEPDLLLDAYRHGIFPWPHEGLPLLWFSPDPRFVLVPDQAHLSRSLRKEMRRGTFGVRSDTAFVEVMRGCAAVPRPEARGTWITRSMLRGYTTLHRRGLAHSIEAWREGRLVGGLYGVSLGGAFFGESMFALEPNASKVCLGTLLGNLVHWGFELLDCQAYTEHLETFGAEEWPRQQFLERLREVLESPTKPGPWTLDLGPAEAAARFQAPAGLL